MMAKMKAMLIYFDPQTYDELHKKRANGYSISALVRRFIREGLVKMNERRRFDT